MFLEISTSKCQQLICSFMVGFLILSLFFQSTTIFCILKNYLTGHLGSLRFVPSKNARFSYPNFGYKYLLMIPELDIRFYNFHSLLSKF